MDGWDRVGYPPPPPWGGVDIDFLGGTRVIDTVDRQIRFGRTSANITDPDGNLLFSTNGAYLANAVGVQMQGGGA